VTLHPAAAGGFSAGADAYERGRPTYPDDAIAVLVRELDLRPGRRVLDLAAGTGKLTRLLVPSGADIVAVEPITEMRQQFAAVLPSVPILDGRAEQIPLPDADVDAVTVAQAFHWFDLAGACREIARVLRSDGRLGLVWNERDTRVPWVAELSRIIRWDERGKWNVPYTVEQDWPALFAAADVPFTPLARYDTGHVQTLDVETLVARVLSTSYIAAQPADAQAGIEARVRALAVALPDVIELPYVTVVFWCRLTTKTPS
jgi:SAM-dependent methyltransferase